MISNELSSVQLKDADRARLAEAMKNYTGEITIIDRPIIRPDTVRPFSSSLVLPGSNTAEKQGTADQKIIKGIKELAAKGVGISGMKIQLRVDLPRLRRLAKIAGVEIPKARKSQVTTLGDKARAARVELGRKNREALARQLRTLAGNGWTIQAMSDATGACRNTILRTLEEFNIKRGPKMRLE